jgi:hypothetical protein
MKPKLLGPDKRIGSFSRISNCNWGYGSRRVSRGFLTQLLHLPIGHRGWGPPVRPTDAGRERDRSWVAINWPCRELTWLDF